MNLRRLTKQLKREAQANPGKATLLAVLAVVGLYFWAPLVAKWVSPESVGDDGTERSVVAAPGDPAPSTVPDPPGFQPKAAEQRSWRDWVSGAADHPRRGPAKGWSEQRDPFTPAGRQALLLEQEQKLMRQLAATKDKGPALPAGITAKSARPKPVELTPKSAGLMLTTTVVGEDRKLAMIKGNFVKRSRTYKQALVTEGDLLTIRTGSAEPSAAKAREAKEPSPKPATAKSSTAKSPSAKTSTAKNPTGKSPAANSTAAKSTSATKSTNASNTMENDKPAPADDAARQGETKEESGTMRIVRITPRSVWVEIAGKKHELRLATPKLAGSTTLRTVTEDR